MSKPRIGIIGAGMAGLACARSLAASGVSPTLLDKGRGVGGRLATRRAPGGLSFDHGAQYVTARSDGFIATLNSLCDNGEAAEWVMEGQTAFTGVPSMNALAKALAEGLDIRRETKADRIEAHGNGWTVFAGSDSFVFDVLIVTAPAPQTVDLLGGDHPLARQIAHVRLLPCWTLMAAFTQPPDVTWASRRDPSGVLAWISREASKPGRADTAAFVAQASPEWSKDHLDHDRADVETLLLKALSDTLSVDPGSAHHAAAHRWLYAKTETPLGSPFLNNAEATLYFGGDWCLGARVEAAWQSGTAIAEDVLRQLA
ncbi:deoxyribodipyrimidine photolyase [Roseibium denhamense]|uniref:Amine oxidase domain-containing protein n=2 Tax=Roseibium denhamense TaxID=76305 RepID=A0ABY1NNW6_9HYPH|nr:deoxyribodipyrimidine photolyase [Roseibium denhamense]SMP14438.1 hypothetical protein SAMN06265374_1431 [Roseibium denhamense]